MLTKLKTFLWDIRIAFRKLFSTDKGFDSGHALEPLLEQPENDGPEIPEGMTAEQFMLCNIVAEKKADIVQFLSVLKITNQVPEGEKPPYNPINLDDAMAEFDQAFFSLDAAVRG